MKYYIKNKYNCLTLDNRYIPPNKLDWAIFFIVFFQFLFIVVLYSMLNLELNFRSIYYQIFVITIVSTVSLFYTYYRYSPQLASFTRAIAQAVAVTNVGSPLSYFAASFNFPLRDVDFDAIDSILCFNWKLYFNWVVERPFLLVIYNKLYILFIPVAIFVIICLSFLRRYRQLSVFMLSFSVVVFFVIVISAIFPAGTAYYFYKISPDMHKGALLPVANQYMDSLFLLRNDGLKTFNWSEVQGIIAFPSLHAATGILFIRALWSVPWIRWLGLVYSSIMIASTPVSGSHYLVDVIAGVVLAWICFSICDWWSLRTHSSEAVRGREMETVSDVG